MGSDVAGIRCRATPDGDDYILNGTKYWITNGGIADYMSIFATVDPALRHEGICAFLVEKEWKGVSIGRRIPKLGQRGSEHGRHPLEQRARAEGKRARPARRGVRARHEDLRPDPAGDRRLCRGGGPLGDGVRHRLRQAAAGLRIAHRGVPGHPAQDRRHVPEGRNGPPAGLEVGLGGGPGHGPDHRRLGRKALLDRSRGRDRQRGAADLRRVRLHQAVPDRKDPAGLPSVPDLRGHQRNPASDPRRPRA